MNSKLLLIFLLIFVFASGCVDEEVLPKPKAMLRLEFEKPQGVSVETSYFSFEKNKAAAFNSKNGRSIALRYPELNASIFMSYRTVNGDIKNLISDAQKLSYEHAAKADGIRPRVYDDGVNKIYGAFFEVSGDAASPAQFYVTDSIHHFVTGALYFETRPNYDSILPAAVYLQNDMGRIMETLRWKK